MKEKATPVPFRGHPGGFPSDDILYEITDAESDYGLIYPDLQWQYPPLNVLRYGADRHGLLDSQPAFQIAEDVAGRAITLDSNVFLTNWITSLLESTVVVPRGAYRMNQHVAGVNRVRHVGEGPTTSIIFASEGFLSSMMWNYDNSTTPQFGCRFEQLRLHASNRAGISRIIRASSWQEHCGLFDCSIDGYQAGAVGLKIEDASSGAAMCSVERTTFGGFSGNKAAIEVDSTVPNAFVMDVKHVTINPSGTATQGILVDNGILHGDAIHIENATDGIVLGTGVDAYLRSITGNASVPDVISLPAAYLGGLRAFLIEPNGGTNALNNNGTPTAGFAAALTVN